MSWVPLLAAVAATVTQPSPVAIGQARGAALQANAKHALQLLQGLDMGSLSESDRKFVACMRHRFGSSLEPKANKPRRFTDRVLGIYQSYWHAALTMPNMRHAQEKRLDASLRRLLKVPMSVDPEPELEKRIRAGGYHELGGHTGLLRDLMVWAKEDDKLTHVALPEGEYDVKVDYLDDFKSFGWSYYATCGTASTGGWTTDDALHVVVPRYESLDGEDFQVNFLDHESQHFADKARFKDLKPWELEYRAKLVEVAMAHQTRAKVLTSFVENQGDDPADAHSYADRKVLDELVKRLRLSRVQDLYLVDRARLQSAARDILLEDSRQRLAASAHSEPS
jgi:hypothetical protein